MAAADVFVMINRLSTFGRLAVSLSLVTLAACSGGPTSNGSGDLADQGDPAATGPKLPGSNGKTPGSTGDNTPGTPNNPGAPQTNNPAVPNNPANPGSGPAALPDGNVSTVATSCNSTGGVNGNGLITRTTRTASSFTDVMNELAGDVVIQEGSTFRVQVETDSNLQSYVTTDVQSGAILLSTKPSSSVCFNALRIIVTLPSVRAVVLDGAGDIDFAKTSAASDLLLTNAGAGAINFSGKARALSLDLSGAGAIHLASGSATSTSVRLTGAGSVDGSAFTPGALTKNVSGAGDVSL